MTRGHPLHFKDWVGLNYVGQNIKDEALFPIGDFANHHQPQSLNKAEDMISYNLKLIKEQSNNNSTMKNHEGCYYSDSFAFVSTVGYRPGDEYKYTYTSNVDPMSLISGYGISLLGNPYADITIDVPNLLFGKP